MGTSNSKLSMDWSDDKKKNLLKELNDFQSGNSVETLRILLYGPVGAGKSSFINSLDSCLQGRIKNRALADSMTGKSFTQETKSYKLMGETKRSFLPFILIDTKGFEERENGMKSDDIFRILQGHKDKPDTPNNEKNKSTLKDKIHCLVAVLPANNISFMGDDVITQMREVRLKARDLGIPQVIIMTKVDEACPKVKYNIRDVYKSKKIEERVEQCHTGLGVPMSYIYPVKNYHKEKDTNTEMDILILDAMLKIVNFANDFVKDQTDSK